MCIVFTIFIAFITPKTNINASFMIKATKIIHREQTRIKVNFPYNQAHINLLRQIEDSKWSATHKAWHIPYTQQAFSQLKMLFPEVSIEKTAIEKQTLILPPTLFRLFHKKQLNKKVLV
jgi:hypothetical protein